MKVISWNLLHLIGADAEDVAALVEQHHPDLVLLQEATEELAALPGIVRGHFFREPLDGRNYGLAAWSPHPLRRPSTLPLPASSVPGRVPPRVAQIVKLHGIAFANVHLSHGQFLNRWQLFQIARAFDGPAAIVGDYNAVGPVKLASFKDIGPRQATHAANNIIPFRLDRCMARGLRCSHARVLERGASDHRPIMLDLHVIPEKAERPVWRDAAQLRSSVNLRASVTRSLRAMARAPDRIRVPQSLFEALNSKWKRDKRAPLQGASFPKIPSGLDSRTGTESSHHDR